ncbi:MAG: peptide chain release factor N(5)-glutamine methyltransferase [Saprospiraceae bacterium]|nr:peptide chain release factor N(5)-glutamine methyltransferase [Saprospiraceae bacterium]
MDRQTLTSAKARLADHFGSREADNIMRLLVDHLEEQTGDPNVWLDAAVSAVLEGVPVQYVTGVAWFYGRPFIVTPDVLIPRPETEELVNWIASDLQTPGRATQSALDIGTGSGCIAVTLALACPWLELTAIDISAPALAVARRNALRHGATVAWRHADILSQGFPADTRYDIVVSNPPYVAADERALMDASVLEHEPPIALWPDGDDPLVFYRKIATGAMAHLTPAGAVYVELNEYRKDEIEHIFTVAGWQTESRKDMQGRWRMLKAQVSEAHIHSPFPKRM